MMLNMDDIKENIITLAIETSCDETSVAIVKNGREVLSNVISSQIDVHKRYGGVVPEVASRLHLEAMNSILQQSLDEAGLSLKDIDVICVTKGPGLIGALLVGISCAKSLSYCLKKPTENLLFKIEDFGDRSIVLREVPMIFGLPTYVDFIRDIIDSLDKDISSNYEADMYKIMRKACKASVKAGDDLSDIEIEALIRDLKNCENPYTCPHGRPTIVEVSKHTISKLFLRE